MGGSGCWVPPLPPTSRTLGLLAYFSPFLCNMGLAVTVSLHERQYRIMNESSGLKKAKVHGLGKPQTRERHVFVWQRDRAWECSDCVF